MLAVVSLANADRAEHLSNQIAKIDCAHFTCSLDGTDFPGSHVVTADNPRNLAAARNQTAEAALAAGATKLIFLDADCVPGEGMVEAYSAQLDAHPDAVICGPVTYLPATEPHPARPVADRPATPEEYNLFWSLSFALTAQTWRQSGGFDEAYVGYGGEDTDFAYTLRERGIGMRWASAPHAFHQWHPVSNPPVEHVVDICTNAAVFHNKWGAWPMEGWFAAFRERGLVTSRMTPRRVLIVVPAHNEECFIGGCLDALLGLDCPLPVSITVVLDNCTDSTAEVVASYPGITALEVDCRNVGGARHAGAMSALRELEGVDPRDVVLFNTDADSRPPRDWILTHLEALAGGADAVAGNVVVDWEESTRCAEVQDRYEEHYTYADGHRHVHGANLSVRGDSFLAAGGFKQLAVDEDVTLVSSLNTVAWIAAAPVVTSPRVSHRAPGGFSTFLDRLE